jgi:adenosylhomocysteine nucleosidase
VVQHDTDTSPLGDPVGLLSGINLVHIKADEALLQALITATKRTGISPTVGTVASGDQFIAADAQKNRIRTHFNAAACEMEGASVAQVAYINNTPFAVVRAISDSADGDASMDYPTFLPIAVRISTELTLNLIKQY